MDYKFDEFENIIENPEIKAVQVYCEVILASNEKEYAIMFPIKTMLSDDKILEELNKLNTIKTN